MGNRPSRSGRLLPLAGFTVLVAAVVALGLLGGEPVETDVEPLGSVAVVPEITTAALEPLPVTEVDSPWCVALLDLDEPDGPAGDDLVSAYRSIAAGAPAALAADLLGAAVLIEAGSPLVGGEEIGTTSTLPVTSDPSLTLPEDFDAEGRPLEDDPRLRVASYVETVCRATGSNPGPPPTQPLLGIDGTQPDAP